MVVLFNTAKKPKAHVFGRHVKMFVFEAFGRFLYIFL